MTAPGLAAMQTTSILSRLKVIRLAVTTLVDDSVMFLSREVMPCIMCRSLIWMYRG